MTIVFDTLEYARRLRDAGFSEEQAEGQARALANAMTDTLATKQDLRELEARLDTRLSEMEKRFDTRLCEVEKRFDTRLSEMEKRLDNRLLEIEKRSDNRFAEMDSRADIRFREVHAQMRGDLADLERRMTLRLGAIVVAMTGIGSAVVKLL